MNDAPAAASAGGLFGPRREVGNLSARSIGGGIAGFLASGGNRVIRLAAMLVLARLLTPADFGVFAIVTTFIGIAGLFYELGLGNATVQRQDLRAEQVNSLFWINVSGGAVMTLTVAFGAPLLGVFYGDPRVETMCLMLSATSLLGSLGVQHLALLQRAMRYRTLAAIGLFATACGSATAVLCAWSGHAFASLAAGFVVTRLAMTSLAWLACPWRPGRPRLAPDTGDLLKFAGYLVGFGVLGMVGTGLHNVLLGITSGLEGAGLYYRAYSLVQLVQDSIVNNLAVVAIVALSHVKDRPELFRRQYLGFARFLASVCAPLAAGGYLFATDIMALVFGPQWEDSAPLFSTLCLSVVFYALSHTAGWIYIANGNSRGMMSWGVLGWTIVVLGTWIGVHHGLQGLAVAQALTAALVFVPCMPLAFRRTPIGMKDFLANIWRPMIAAAAAAMATAVAMRFLLPPPGPLRLVDGGLLFGGLYLYLLSEPLGQRADILRFAADVFDRLRRWSTAA